MLVVSFCSNYSSQSHNGPGLCVIIAYIYYHCFSDTLPLHGNICDKTVAAKFAPSLFNAIPPNPSKLPVDCPSVDGDGALFACGHLGVMPGDGGRCVVCCTCHRAC